LRQRRRTARQAGAVGSSEETLAEREQKKKQAPAKSDEVVEEVPQKSEQGEKIKAELDDLLDEIDEVLESNAEDFVKSYVQKGGE
jgi:ubiquitin-like protein Pup